MTEPAVTPAVTGDPTSRIARSVRETLGTELAGLNALAEALAEPPLGTALAEATTRILHMAGRVVVTGIGKSGHIGRKIQATLASTGTPSLFIHPAEASHGDLGMIGPADIVLALSQSGETAELADILAHTRRHGLTLIGITTAPTSTLARASDIPLILPPATEACPMGLAPTTSTLMQLALGDAIAIALLDLRGFTADEFGAFHPGGKLGARLRPVSTLMHTGPTMPLGTADMTLSAVIMEMTRKAFGCVGILSETGTLQGLITDADLRHALHRDLHSTTAHAIMNPNPITTTPETLAQDALRLMNARAKPITSLFVLNPSQHPVGILHLHDLLRAGLA